jgi:hypothetical protein
MDTEDYFSWIDLKFVPYFKNIVDLAARKHRREKNSCQSKPKPLRVMISPELVSHQKGRYDDCNELEDCVAADFKIISAYDGVHLTACVFEIF